MLKIITTDMNTYTSAFRPLHVLTADGGTFCGKSPERFRDLGPADWSTLHEGKPWGLYCEVCRKRAFLRLRPKAVFWYLDPFNGDHKEFPTLKEAEKSASKEHGCVSIHQLGPGEGDKLVKFVRGYDPLP